MLALILFGCGSRHSSGPADATQSTVLTAAGISNTSESLDCSFIHLAGNWNYLNTTKHLTIENDCSFHDDVCNSNGTIIPNGAQYSLTAPIGICNDDSISNLQITNLATQYAAEAAGQVLSQPGLTVAQQSRLSSEAYSQALQEYSQYYQLNFDSYTLTKN